MPLWNKFGQVEIYNGLRSKMKLSKGCSFSSKEKRGRERDREGMEWEGREGEERGGTGNHYFKCNVMPAGPKDFQMLLLYTLFQL